MRACIKYIVIASFLVLACGRQGNESSGTLRVATRQIDFGNIAYGTTATYHLKYTNEGYEPFTIVDILAGCGCTTFQWNKQPLEPDEEGSIKITYHPKYYGRFKETIRVLTNTHADSILTFSIKGRVIGE